MEQIKSIFLNVPTTVLIAWGSMILGVVLICFYMFKKTDNYINVLKIVKDHFKIFNGANKHIIVLYIAPAFLSVGIALLYDIESELIDSIMVVASVIISALLAFQGSIININKDKGSRTDKLLEETNSSIIFVVLINIILIFLLLFTMAIANKIINKFLDILIIYILIITLFTMLIIIKRVRKLFESHE